MHHDKLDSLYRAGFDRLTVRNLLVLELAGRSEGITINELAERLNVSYGAAKRAIGVVRRSPVRAIEHDGFRRNERFINKAGHIAHTQKHEEYVYRLTYQFKQILG